VSNFKDFLERLELINHIIIHGTGEFKRLIEQLNNSNDRLITALNNAQKGK
jgi:hypothetical protein